MATITLNRQVFGTGYSGRVDIPAGGLSWIDSAALQSTALNTWQTSVEAQRAREALDRLNYTTEDVADAVARMEGSLGLKLEAQTQVIAHQSEILQEIRGAVLNPAKTRAAERIADATQLLQAERFERALEVSREATEADPNNPNGFFAAGWALVGLGRLDEARASFEEARDASQGDQRSLGSRQAARSAFLSEKPDLAYSLIRDARNVAESADEQAAVAYDVAVYAWAAGDPETAKQSLEAACQHDSRHAERAMLDPAFEHAPALRNSAARLLLEWAEQVAASHDALAQEVADVRNALPEPPTDPRDHSELGHGLRPELDWQALRAELDQRLSDAEQIDKQIERGVSLQVVARTLAEALAHTQELLREVLPRLAQAISEHDEAAVRHDELAQEHQRLLATRRQWAWLVALRRTVRPNYRRYIWGGVILGLLGAVNLFFMVFGVALLLIAGVSWIGGGIAERECRTIDEATSTLGHELRTKDT